MVNKFTEKNLITYKRLIRDGYQPAKVISFLLDSAGISKSDIAEQCQVHRSYVTLVLSGRRKCAKVDNAISEAIFSKNFDLNGMR